MKKVILSLGGSLIVPDEVQTDFLQKFRSLLLAKIEQDFQFVIFTGGGKTCRKYQEAASAIVPMTDQQLDWLGIHSSRLNAQLIKTIFEEHARREIITDPSKEIDILNPVIIGGGWKPGWSTDFCAVQFAAIHKFTHVINLSNITYAYDKDPNKFSDAQPIKDIVWADFRKIVGDVWKPGLNAPFDPIASKLAQEKNIQVVICDGKKLDNVRNILEDKEFIGTYIHN
ncbi:MAG: hypothetical protein A2233_05285 [Candidatus Kerfeldbacteria bacterium RIFOXYA2_FULL_38_24]|uniref:UMP kinase n=1 Tax=Candidatus Kerfeldbacteria bacterium RIFOXYB2_FULL_38_14 TaxID=1798547 RepID=A0A1G2BG96_9BACT|nr:MAG: hypothetical protein A2233_05285 [Candidatus Kerfeldbacteria bacterium RIFOXYA2_FULL_38_24]OGY88243.1 MAG: hypothetical protein A2319_03580 [Candidatus Kerfeldbacteria bacterium RIFOXYB2_FULL_38_14]OGY89438.1 MAG: hypothetical protein A2458_00635 [Candidatus Kerfeldbacteria bacterium RIFOXYC2_FULL_38_9]